MDIPVASTLETKEMNSIDEHESLSFETPHVSCSLLESLEFVLLKTTCSYEYPNHFLVLLSKLFRRMVVDAFIYHKYCKSHSGIVVLTLQLERKCPMLGGQARNYTTTDSCRTKFPQSSLRP